MSVSRGGPDRLRDWGATGVFGARGDLAWTSGAGGEGFGVGSRGDGRLQLRSLSDEGFEGDGCKRKKHHAVISFRADAGRVSRVETHIVVLLLFSLLF